MNKTSSCHWIFSDKWIISILLAATILSRWPFHATILESHDAINYALALDEFDMRLHQPQPPGYPLYILVGRFFHLFIHSHLDALVWTSTVFSGLAVIAVYFAGKDIFNHRTGVIAALFLAFSTDFWYQGEIATPYTMDLFASVTVGWLCYRLAGSSKKQDAWLTALAIGLAGAFRLQTMIFLFPLFLYALHRQTLKTAVVAFAIAIITFGLFMVPAIMVSGGLNAFIRSMRTTVPVFWSANTLQQSVTTTRYLENLRIIATYTFCAVGEMILPFILIGYFSQPNRLRFWRNSKLFLFALWLLPIWLIYLLIWPGNPGTILVSLPPFLLLAAAGMDSILKHSSRGKIIGLIWASAMLVWNIVLFTSIPSNPLGETYRQFRNLDAITDRIEYFESKLGLLQEIPAEGTIIYANAFRHLQYYRPDLIAFSPPALYRSKPQIARTIVAVKNGRTETWNDVAVDELIPENTKHIVFFDLPPEALIADPSLISTLTKNNHKIQVLSPLTDFQAIWTQDGLVVQTD